MPKPRDILTTESGTLYQPQISYAFRALGTGEATPEQQSKALAWILESACVMKGRCYAGENVNETMRMLGRRDAGLDIAEVMSMKFKPNQESEDG